MEGLREIEKEGRNGDRPEAEGTVPSGGWYWGQLLITDTC